MGWYLGLVVEFFTKVQFEIVALPGFFIFAEFFHDNLLFDNFGSPPSFATLPLPFTIHHYHPQSSLISPTPKLLCPTPKPKC